MESVLPFHEPLRPLRKMHSSCKNINFFLCTVHGRKKLFSMLHVTSVALQLAERSLPTHRGLRFESSHQHFFSCILFTVNCLEKTKNEEKEGGNGPFKKDNLLGPDSIPYHLQPKWLTIYLWFVVQMQRLNNNVMTSNTLLWSRRTNWNGEVNWKQTSTSIMAKWFVTP